MVIMAHRPNRSFRDQERVAKMPDVRTWEDLILYDNEGEEHVDVGILPSTCCISNSSPSLKGSRDINPCPWRGNPIPRPNQDTRSPSLDPSISTLTRALEAMGEKETIDPRLTSLKPVPMCGGCCDFNSFLDQAASAVNAPRKGRKRSSRKAPSLPTAAARQTIQGGSRDRPQIDSKRPAPMQLLKEGSPPRRQGSYVSPFDDIPVHTDRLEAATNANAELPFDFEHVDQDLIDLMSSCSPSR